MPLIHHPVGLFLQPLQLAIGARDGNETGNDDPSINHPAGGFL